VFCFTYLAIAVLIALLKLHYVLLFLCPSQSSALRFIGLFLPFSIYFETPRLQGTGDESMINSMILVKG